ncbi:beta galactosidase jelly roll domain-containing protein [Sphingomonas sp. CFBP 13714]|uniref:glycosyl hydrolase 2 galactose-binding domain-containing protein n=1 Tax=Sphingomonas sp. CFBP 13714 TaxID=2775308 RepID=UPI001783BB67|nr:LamG-like jellyroll fold domain-containing protein [Sphingomonas sp. CFBP 13714]MBD8699648.1 beta galactosidase jelly roll domain-containing protein [Sphingomonas sp. CFBP 13714]
MSAIRIYTASLCAGVAAMQGPAQAAAQQVDWPSSRIAHPKRAAIGPYNAVFLAGSDGLERPVQGYAADEALPPMPQWTMRAWINPTLLPKGRVPVAAIGNPAGAAARVFALDDGKPVFQMGSTTLRATAAITRESWHLLTATADAGRVRFFVDGRLVGTAAAEAMPPATGVVALGPRLPGQAGFAGRIAAFALDPVLLGAPAIASLARRQPDAALIRFEDASPSWPLQVKTQYGLTAPQPAWELPTGKAPFSKPVASPVSTAPALAPTREGHYAVNAWRLVAAPTVAANGAAISQPGFDARSWHAATVPGTVLTTLVDRGVYPDPTIGLNNMAIPESLSRQSWWYRSEFTLPATPARRLTLTFDGVNYAAQVWVNGTAVGDVKGAFIRGRFDVTDRLRPGQRNSIAVLVAPPPHPGIAHEQSLAGGRGDNGGALMSDGPTFGASEGWDWIPGVRDRNTGLWQGVDLAATGFMTIGDPAVSTRLPRPDNAVAEVSIEVPVTNHGTAPASATVRAAFDDVAVEQRVTLTAGASQVVRFTPSSFPQLAVQKPKLWWPNGYGDPALHRLDLTVASDRVVSDRRSLDFGMRSVTYELSSLDTAGALRRVLVDTALAHDLGTPVIDERHPALRKVRGGWANSLMPGAETSPAVTALPDDPLSPQMVLRVNGVRIAARGGNWGMDDMMKRVGTDRLTPYFRLHREAGMNIIRNWMGQSTEEAFYALADRHGLMVLNDFWESTQDNDAEAQDVPLFVANARDVVRRYRTHPSIILWFGRNEGVPQPILQTALQDMVWREDGTRLYKGNSRVINLGGSGPYEWHPPEDYFTGYPHGFAIEVGTASFPTLESWQRTVPVEDRWPISDTWVYHDWHQERGVSMASFVRAMDTEFGPARDLADFERKAQMLNYESHRAIFEGFNAGLWTTNSARMLWMTHPAWPSSDFQIYSSDYDTHAAFYGTKKGAEPVHIQMNQPGRQVVMVNTTRQPLTGVKATARVTDLTGATVATHAQTVDLPANATVALFPLALDAALAKGPVLVRLDASAADGSRVSENFYWQAANPADLRALSAMPQATLRADVAAGTAAAGERSLRVTLSNPGTTPALQTKLTLFDGRGVQILPAYFSDNYVSLLPGETRDVTVAYPGDRGVASVRLRGWNSPATTIGGK